MRRTVAKPIIRAAVLGGDVSKSRSPVIHQAAFKLLGVTGSYDHFSVDARGFRPLVRRLFRDGYAYVNVTIPHKRRAAELATTRSATVRATRAANTLVLRRVGTTTAIAAENTDGVGLLRALADLGVTRLRGTRVVMVGAGGAAAGALHALLAAGAHVRVLARRPRAARDLVAHVPVAARARASAAAWTPAGLGEALRDAAVLISAVPADAWAQAPARACLVNLPRSAAVLEMAYGGVTPLARAARTYVARYQDGLPMLVHQAGRAVECALGRRPAPGPLLRAARG